MDEFGYINQFYGLSIKKGTRVKYSDKWCKKEGVVYGADGCYVKIGWDGEKHTLYYHPLSDGLEYQEPGIIDNDDIQILNHPADPEPVTCEAECVGRK